MKHFIKQVFSLQFLVSKPLIVLLITAGCGLWTEINAQYRQDRSIIRGNVTSITIKYPGDITTDSLFLQVRTTSSFTSTIHIAKENTVAGGSDAEILATYSYPYTTVKIFFSSANTSGLAIANYYYDLRKSVSPDSAVLIYGTFKIQSYAGEVVNGLAGGGSNESIIKSWIGDSADVIRMELADYVLENDLSDSLDNIRTLIGTGGVALPDSVLFSTDSTAQRTFSDLKYVDKASTQTITGNKTFSGNKTVFGTTTNDSVAVRGRLNVSGNIIGLTGKFSNLSNNTIPYNNTSTGLADSRISQDANTTYIRGGSTATSLGSELLTNGTFDTDLSGWTAGAGWGWDSGTAKHTTGNTATLEQSFSTSNNVMYQITVTITNRTAGSITLSFNNGQQNYAGITATGTYHILSTLTSSNKIIITPTTDFNGSMDEVSVKLLTASLPSFILKNTDNSNSGVQIRTGNSANNFYFGIDAGKNNTTGIYNSAIGYQALLSNTIGQLNLAIGYQALYSNTTGQSNSAIGYQALYSNTTGQYNSAIGRDALRSNTSGYYNSAIGRDALYSNTTGSYNSAIGYFALRSIVGQGNIGISYQAGRYNADNSEHTTGNYSNYFGYDTKASTNGVSNENVFGYQAVGMGSNTFVFGSNAITDTYLKGKVHINNDLDVAGNKTVFGTTTNDSVRVTGRLQVNNLGIGSKYNLATGTGFMFNKSTMKQQNFTGASLINHISNYDLDETGADVLWGLTNSSGAGIFTYNLAPYSFAFNSFYGHPIYIGTNSFISLGLFPLKTYMEIDSLKFGSYVNNVFNPVNKVTFVADTFNISGVTIINGSVYSQSGSVGNADSLGALPSSAYVLKSGLDSWSSNLYSVSSNEMRLGKSYNTKRFNNGAYSDVWNIDYVIPPYNLSASWLFPIEHRTDYYNDTLQTVSGVANLLKIDGTGTPIWKSSTVTIAGQETQVNIGDLPDSTTLNYSASSTIGNNVILSEENMTASETRYPMQIKGYNFRLGTNNNYILPKLYSYYSDLSTGNIEDGYHFYGNGNYPSYFGGNIYTDGYLRVQDSIIIGTSTVKIYPDSITIGGIKVNPSGGSGIDTAKVNDLIKDYNDSTGVSIIGTQGTLDSIITAFWNGSLGSGSTWDSTYAYQRIAALESTVTSLQNSINNILAALDTCGCSASTADNTPPLAPTSYVAIGGTSQTQYVTTWTDPIASDLDSIRWYEGSSNDTTSMTWITSIAGGTQTYTRTGRTANTTYWSAIKAVDDSGNVSYFSNVDSATTLPTGGVSPIATLDFEEGNLSEWSSTSGANLSASTTFKHTGSYSMRVGTNSHGTFNFSAETEVWLTFWLYLPSTSSQSATTNYIALFNDGIGDRSWIGTNDNGGGTWEEWVYGTNTSEFNDDDITTNFSEDTWHKVKIYYKTNGSNLSNHQVWIDDTSIWSDTGIFTNSATTITVGSQAATITNYFYIDDIKLYDTDPGDAN